MRSDCSLSGLTAGATAVSLLILVVFAAPAAAGNHDSDSGLDGAGVVVDDVADTATVMAGHDSARGGEGASGGSGGSGGPMCRWYRAAEYPVVDGKVAYYQHCQGRQPDLVWSSGGGAPGAEVPVEVLRERAVDGLRLPTPVVRTSPPWDKQGVLVHLPVWLWVDGAVWGARSASASAGPVAVTATAAPQRVLWQMGNGDVVVCQGAGTPYAPRAHRPEQASPDCGYSYRHSSAGRAGDVYLVTVTVEYGVSWSVQGAEGGGPLPVMRTSRSIPVPVYEIQVLNY